MAVTLKLFAMLARYLPSEAVHQAVELELASPITPHQLLDRFTVPREKVHLVLLNGRYLQPGERDQTILKDGDVVAVWPPVAGG